MLLHVVSGGVWCSWRPPRVPPAVSRLAGVALGQHPSLRMAHLPCPCPTLGRRLGTCNPGSTGTMGVRRRSAQPASSVAPARSTCLAEGTTTTRAAAVVARAAGGRKRHASPSPGARSRAVSVARVGHVVATEAPVSEAEQQLRSKKRVRPAPATDTAAEPTTEAATPPRPSCKSLMHVVSTAASAETHKLASPNAGGGGKSYKARSMTSDDDEDDDDEDEDEGDTQELDAGDRDGDDGVTDTESAGSSMECHLEDGLERGHIFASSEKSRRTGPSMTTQVPAALKTRTKAATGK
jgi:hypothetical protein